MLNFKTHKTYTFTSLQSYYHIHSHKYIKHDENVTYDLPRRQIKVK